MDFPIDAAGWLTAGQHRYRCALGRSGIRADKCEGDGATPTGRLPIRTVLYRADRLERPVTRLPCRPLREIDGWCDDPGDRAYNRPVTRPYPGRHEVLWRDDAVYDIVAVLGWNDDPVVPAAGSAIFLHLARPNYEPTEGCVALARADCLSVLRLAGPESHLVVPGAPLS